MKYKKLHIIGGPGSGKTYCARQLSKKWDIDHFDLDNIFWDKSVNHYGIKNSKNKREEELKKILKKDKYIIEGVYYSWLKESFKSADLIIILKPSVWLRDYRIIRRFIKRKLGLIKSKKETLRDLINLLKYNHSYDQNNLQNALQIINKNNQNILFVKTYQELKEQLECYNENKKDENNGNKL